MALDKRKLYDLATASPLIAFYAWGVWQDFPTLMTLAESMSRDGADTYAAVQIAAIFSGMCFGALLVGLLIMRMPPVGKAQGIMPRAVAVAGTFAVLGFQHLPGAGLSLSVETIALLFVLAGTALTAYALIFLGRSFSIVPEARKLVTTGPYRFVRHPVYAFEEIAVLGLAAQHQQPEATALLLIHFALQFTRLNYEENVLARSFPEYKEYAARTARLLPGIY